MLKNDLLMLKNAHLVKRIFKLERLVRDIILVVKSSAKEIEQILADLPSLKVWQKKVLLIKNCP